MRMGLVGNAHAAKAKVPAVMAKEMLRSVFLNRILKRDLQSELGTVVQPPSIGGGCPSPGRPGVFVLLLHILQIDRQLRVALIALLQEIVHFFGREERRIRSVCLPPFHDVLLCQGILQCLR